MIKSKIILKKEGEDEGADDIHTVSVQCTIFLLGIGVYIIYPNGNHLMIVGIAQKPR